MTAVELVQTLRAKGVELVPAGTRLLFRPREVVTTEEREALRQHKPELLRLLAELQIHEPIRPLALDSAVVVARLLGMPLDHFAQEGYPLEIQVPWLQVTLWFVPTKADAEALRQEGISPGRIWTAKELMDLMTLPGLTQEQVQTVALAKLEFGGQVVEVRPRRRAEAP